MIENWLVKWAPVEGEVQTTREISPPAQKALEFLYAIHNYNASSEATIFYRAEIKGVQMRVEIGDMGDPNYSVYPVFINKEPVETIDFLIDLLGRDESRKPDFDRRLYLLYVYAKTDPEMAKQVWGKWVNENKSCGITEFPNLEQLFKGY